MKDSLTKTLNDTEQEINALTASKRTAEYALEVKVMPLEIALKCLDTREQRITIDYVRDTVESELHKVGCISVPVLTHASCSAQSMFSWLIVPSLLNHLIFILGSRSDIRY